MQTIIPWQKIKVMKSLGKKKAVKKSTKKSKVKSLYGILKTKPSSIEGILKGVDSTWEDFEEVKRMWFDEEHLLHQKHKK